MQDEKNNKMNISSSEVTMLSNELTYRKYLLNKDNMPNRDNVRKFFQKLTKPEYIALHIIKETEEKADIYSGKTYLKELSEKMQLHIRQISKMVAALRDRGLLTWAHDGDGSEGTYVTITESGKKLLAEEEAVLKSYYGKVIEKFGKENMIQLLQLMKQLETVMSGELEEMMIASGEIREDEEGSAVYE